MAPITLFDKSFLQSLNVDESVWFDRFFYSLICPIFYVETLADLKKPKLRRSPEQEVGIIADKFPEIHCMPTVHHQNMAISDLLGNHVPLTGQIPRDPSRFVASDGHKGVIFEESPEEEAFLRWQAREFHDLEREFASTWRANLESLDLKRIPDEFRKLGISGRNCKTLQEAKSIADAIVNGTDKTLEMLRFAFFVLDIPQETRNLIMERWLKSELLPILSFAPYAAHILTVEIFFQIALEANLISSNRPSNRLDIAYLYYLPFCMVFVSSDRLHRKCAPLFLQKSQQKDPSFIWGPELKSALSALDQHYSALPESERKKGVMHFASYPPTEIDSIISREWDKHLHGWRECAKQSPTKSDSNPEAVKKLRQIIDAPSLQPNAVNFASENPGFMLIRRNARQKKGKWWQLPHDIEDNDDEKG